MRYVCLLCVLLLSNPSAALARDALRPLDRLAAETFARAITESPTVRALAGAIEGMNLIVHIETTRDLPAGIIGTTRFVASRGGYRYVRIALAVELSPALRIATLRHELQHAREVAESTAGDADAIRQLFQQAGTRDGKYFDTVAAQRIGKRVLGELRQVAMAAQ